MAQLGTLLSYVPSLRGERANHVLASEPMLVSQRLSDKQRPSFKIMDQKCH